VTIIYSTSGLGRLSSNSPRSIFQAFDSETARDMHVDPPSGDFSLIAAVDLTPMEQAISTSPTTSSTNEHEALSVTAERSGASESCRTRERASGSWNPTTTRAPSWVRQGDGPSKLTKAASETSRHAYRVISSIRCSYYPAAPSVLLMAHWCSYQNTLLP